MKAGMNMKILPLLAIFGLCSISSVTGFMGFKMFQDKIHPNCFGQRNPQTGRELSTGQLLPIPNTMEAFLGIVEKLETRHLEWKMVDLIKIFLTNFRYDDVIVKSSTDGDDISTRGPLKMYYELLLKMFSNPTNNQQLKEDDLTQDERCALFFMISHTINDTYREGEETMTVAGGTVLKHRREQGVVTLTSQTKHAFALGKVLLGLLAGIEKSDPVSAFNLLKSFNNAENEELQNVVVNVVYGATFGDILSITKSFLKDNMILPAMDTLFYGNGHWEEAVCPIDYYLEEDSYEYHHASLALIRGAVDGYRLGTNIKRLMNSDNNWKLSQVLRMYYGGIGFPGYQGLSWCNRIVLKFLSIRDEAVNFDKLYSALTDKQSRDEKITKDMESLLKLLEANEPRIFTDVREENDQCDGRVSSVMKCETPVDLFTILDFKAVDQRPLQSIIIGNLSSGMGFGDPSDSSVTVYSNLKSPGGSLELDTLINGSHVSGCGGCAARNYDPVRASYNTETEVFQYLNKSLGKFVSETEENEELYGIPAKVVLYFNFQNPTSDYRLRQVLNEIRWRFRGTKIYAIGSREETLRLFTDETRTVSNANVEKIRQLKEKVCKEPAQFLYNNCYKRDMAMEKNERYQGYISHRQAQYWMMDPKYFLKSFNIKLTFTALTGEIRVCYSRDYNRIFQGKEPNGADCGSTSAGGAEIVFSVSDPCNRVTESNCQPFYFYIEGKNPPKENEPCTDHKCKTLDQISFEFAHEGISCNGASSLVALSSLVTLLYFVVSWTLH